MMNGYNDDNTIERAPADLLEEAAQQAVQQTEDTRNGADQTGPAQNDRMNAGPEEDATTGPAEAAAGRKTEQTRKDDRQKYKPKKDRILMDVSTFPVDEKGNAIVPDDFFMDHYKELPDGTTNTTGNRKAYSGGYVTLLTDEDRARGREKRNELQQKKQSFADAIKKALYSKAPRKTCEELGLDLESSMLECIVAAQTVIAADQGKGSTKAAEFLRDTIGEKPAERQEISADIITAEERALLEKVNARLNQPERRAEQE